jgi:hypothetical protein
MVRMSRLFNSETLTDAALMAKGKSVAAFSLAFWVCAISAGRLLSETYKYLNYHQYLMKLKS